MIKFDRYIGIDVGRGGAIAYIAANRDIKTVKMPETVEQISEYLGYLKSISQNPLACVEKVNTWRTDAEEGKTFGIEKMTRNLTEITTVLRMIKIPYIQIYPVQWQAFLGINKYRGIDHYERKKKYKEYAQQLFPEVVVTMVNADALLIMWYIGMKYKNDPEWVLKKIPESVKTKLI